MLNERASAAELEASPAPAGAQPRFLNRELSWLQVLHGQRVQPASYHPLADLRPEPEIAAYLDEVSGVIGACVDAMPTHARFIADHCAALPVARA